MHTGKDVVPARRIRRSRTRVVSGLVALGLAVAAPAARAQQARYEDVVANLRSADPDLRLSAMRLLDSAGIVEAAAPVAALLADPVDEIQLEAIGVEIHLLSGQRFSGRRRIAGIIEVRGSSAAAAAFRAPDLAPRRAPAEVVTGLLAAMRDPSPPVRLEGVYAFGALVAPDGDLIDPAARQAALDVLAGGLDDPEPRARVASAEVAARLFGACVDGCAAAVPAAIGDAFVNGLNDGAPEVRVASMAVVGAMRYARALQALTDQFQYYGRGPAADAALEALARIAHPSSAPLFRELLRHRDAGVRRRAAEGLARIGDASHAGEIDAALGRDGTEAVALAAAFAAQKLSDSPHVDRFIEAAGHPATRAQAREYLVDLGPAIAPALGVYLRDPAPAIRATVADVLGRIGSAASLEALQPLVRDADPAVAVAATRAIGRLQQRLPT